MFHSRHTPDEPALLKGLGVSAPMSVQNYGGSAAGGGGGGAGGTPGPEGGKKPEGAKTVMHLPTGRYAGPRRRGMVPAYTGAARPGGYVQPRYYALQRAYQPAPGYGGGYAARYVAPRSPARAYRQWARGFRGIDALPIAPTLTTYTGAEASGPEVDPGTATASTGWWGGVSPIVAPPGYEPEGPSTYEPPPSKAAPGGAQFPPPAQPPFQPVFQDPFGKQTCPPNAPHRWPDGSCHACPKGLEPVADAQGRVRCLPACADNQVRAPGGTCVCKDGFHYDPLTKKCVQCGGGLVWHAASKACVRPCRKPLVLNNKGRCVHPTPATGQVSLPAPTRKTATAAKLPQVGSNTQASQAPDDPSLMFPDFEPLPELPPLPEIPPLPDFGAGFAPLGPLPALPSYGTAPVSAEVAEAAPQYAYSAQAQGDTAQVSTTAGGAGLLQKALPWALLAGAGLLLLGGDDRKKTKKGRRA